MSPLLTKDTQLEVGVIYKFVREGEIIAYDVADNKYHMEIALDNGDLGEEIFERDVKRLVDDAGKLRDTGESLVFSDTSGSCRIREDLQKARYDTKRVAKEITGRIIEGSLTLRR